MARIPSYETILFEILKSFDIDALPKKPDKIINLERDMSHHIIDVEESLEELFESLSMDQAAIDAAKFNIEDFKPLVDYIRLNTWTSGAEQRQVLWYMAAYLYVPSLSRRLAFWQLASTLDQGMPGGQFWYLPRIDKNQDKLIMPVATVIDWLLDLLGYTSTEKLASALAGNLDNEDKSLLLGLSQDAINRVLIDWHHSKITPHKNKIEEYFSENIKLRFSGILEIDDTAIIEDKLQTIYNFISKKNLTLELLSKEIPINIETLHAIKNKKVNQNIKEHFITEMLLRYSEPSNRLIRRRLLIAQACQHGYNRITKALMGKSSALNCMDFEKNKTLQLIEIYKRAYNLSIQANNHSPNNYQQQDSWFENQLHPLESEGVYLSILTERPIEYRQGELCNILNRKFFECELHDHLENLICFDDENIFAFNPNQLEQLAKDIDEDETVEQLKKNVSIKAIQDINSYSIIIRLLQSNFTRPYKEPLIKRLYELASTDKENIFAIIQELGFLLNIENKNLHQPNSQNRVIALLDAAFNSPHKNSFLPLILQFEAKHYLNLNKFDDALSKFRDAFECCKTNGFGSVWGEIARDIFAVYCSIKPNGYSLYNMKKYYRIMLEYGVFLSNVDFYSGEPFDEISERLSAALEEQFKDELYRPYPGIPSCFSN